MPTLSVFNSERFVAESFMSQHHVCSFALGVKLKRHLRFMSIGAGRYPGPSETQRSRPIDAAILPGNDEKFFPIRGPHPNDVTAADLRIDLGLRRPEGV